MSKSKKVKVMRTEEAAKVILPGIVPAPVEETAEARLIGMEKALAKQGKRVVAMTDVTVTREKLIKAVIKASKLPGNEVPAFVEFLLKEIIMA